jgi:[citrate (pro-3S)-lyase] ligase
MKIIRWIKRKISSYRDLRNNIKCVTDAYYYLHSKNVTLIFFELPKKKKVKNLTPFEIERINNWVFDFNNIETEMVRLQAIFGKDVDPEYILALYDGGIVINDGRRRRVLDFSNEYVHIINGIRYTCSQPLFYDNRIFIHGACTVRGTGVEDAQTISSYIQEELNIAKIEKVYSTINMGIGRGSSVFDDFEQMKEQNYTPGDIVVWCPFTIPIEYLSKKLLKKPDFYAYETSALFNRPHNYGEWFTDDILHTNKTGNKVIASFIFDKIKEEKLLNYELRPKNQENPDTIALTKGLKIYGDNQELQKCLDDLRRYKKGNEYSRIGSIVMNCNPFTNGHKYLIEYASGLVDFLYIFVVEENKSYFSFEDRFNLIKSGVTHLNNVIILPSGKFIISALTFPGYFYKDDLKDVTIDCSNDINVFAEYIAPTLNIKIRFAGEEPLDPITNQYNQAMKELLPRSGIEFKVISRKESGDSVISASRVRKYYEAGQLDAVKDLVPITTYNYLLERYSKNIHDTNRTES